MSAHIVETSFRIFGIEVWHWLRIIRVQRRRKVKPYLGMTVDSTSRWKQMG